MKIVLDATELIRDPLLNGVQLQVLAEFARQSGAELLVPEVVLREAMRHMDDKGGAAVAQMRKAARNMRLWLGSDVLLRETETLIDGEYRKSYVEQLRTRVQGLGARVIDCPEVTHRRLLNALCARRKPFADDGAGYQDALVWCTVASLAKEHSEVVLITQNHSDFPTDDNGRPIPELLLWLEEDSVPLDRVQVYHSTEAFAAAILPMYPSIRERVQILTGTHPKADLQAAIRANTARILIAAAANTPDNRLPASVREDAHLELRELKLDIKDVTDSADDGIQVLVACTFSTSMGDVRGSEGWSGVFDNWIHTLDRWLGDTIIVSAELSIVFDRHDGRVRTFDVREGTLVREGRGQVLGAPVVWSWRPTEPGEPPNIHVQGPESSQRDDPSSEETST